MCVCVRVYVCECLSVCYICEIVCTLCVFVSMCVLVRVLRIIYAFMCLYMLARIGLHNYVRANNLCVSMRMYYVCAYV